MTGIQRLQIFKVEQELTERANANGGYLTREDVISIICPKPPKIDFSLNKEPINYIELNFNVE